MRSTYGVDSIGDGAAGIRLTGAEPFGCVRDEVNTLANESNLIEY